MKKDRRDLTEQRKYAYVYLLHRFFNGRLGDMAAVMEVPDLKKDMPEWEKSFHDLVMNRIANEGRKDTTEAEGEVPSIKSIKEKILRRCDALINATDDPARIAQVYKILSEFEQKDEKKAVSVIDAINESIQKPGSKLAALEKLVSPTKGQSATSIPGKRGRGRPRKIRPWEVQQALQEKSDAILAGDIPEEEQENTDDNDETETE